ncbi:Alpha/beta hydrolase fold-1 [Mycena galopus ATCC 62051]|nr:Alpha/beta hydrolase fold-1 [Mycena galopus ATCC 62051]
MSSVHIKSIKSIIFDPAPDQRALKLTAKCYTPETSDSKGLTLLCAHGAGAHKEQWEPTLEQIFRMQKTGNYSFSIRDAWSVDWQSHGEGAVVNEAALSDHPGVSVVEWAKAIATFIKSSHLRGRRIVVVGHSAGSSVVLLATQNLLTQSLPFVGMIIVEPVMCSKDYYREFGEGLDSALSTAIMIVKARRKTWLNRDEAFAYMRRNFIWKGWDERILRSYVSYGMKDLPGKDGAIISTTNEQEISAYTNVPPHLQAVDEYRRIAPWVPVHFIFGARNDLVPPEAQDSIFNPKNNIQACSIQRVQRAGHMVLQENPSGLAVAICKALEQIRQPGAKSSPKL